MAVSLGPALWQDGPTYNGELLRQLNVAATWFTGGTADALAVRGGVINNSTGSLQVVSVSGMAIKVCAGFAVIPNSSSNVNGGYMTGSMTSSALTVATADATNPRIDLVVIYVDENGDDTSDSYIDIIAGTPAASPVPPSAPANALVLATVAVAANATSISSTNITDQRVYTTAAGGVVPWPSLTGIPAGHQGLIAYDVTNSRFFHNDASGADQLATLPWQPQVASRLTNGAIPATSTTWMSVNITTDGHTDIKVTLHWNGVYQGSTVGFRNIAFQTYLDSTLLDQVNLCTLPGTTAGAAYNGGTSVYCTSSSTGDTPSAGSHTVYFKFYYHNTSGSGDQPWVLANTGSPATLRVEPVVK
jgi:hypothetical protein